MTDMYAEQLNRLYTAFPGRGAVTVQEAADFLGVNRHTITAAIERKRDPLSARNVGQGKCNRRYVIAIPVLAKWSMGG